jgi:group I intron endonuclease
MQYLIYKITNTINNKIYIGQTKNLKMRIARHKSEALKIHNTKPLYRSIRKNGFKTFLFSIIEECSNANVDEREIFWINYYKSTNKKYGYNLSTGGKGYVGTIKPRISPMKGKKHSKKTKRKMSEQRKGSKNPFYGKTHTQEVKEKLSKNPNRKHFGEENPFYGKKHSKKTKNAISKMASKRVGEKNPFAKLNAVTVLEIREKFKNNKIYMAQLAIDYNISETTVANIIKRRTWKHI